MFLTFSWSHRVFVLMGCLALSGSAEAHDRSIIELPASFGATLPCADCPGILYRVDLIADGMFFSRMSYKERNTSFDDVGRWEIAGTTLVLRGSRGAPEGYTVHPPDSLVRQATTAAEAGLHYELRRLPKFMPIEPDLPMKGLYRADEKEVVFQDCVSALLWRVAAGGDSALVKQAYRTAAEASGEWALASIEAHIVLRAQTPAGDEQPTLVVRRFLGISPEHSCPISTRSR